MSTSFPYLTLSRRLGVRYGDVLKIVDELDRLGQILKDAGRLPSMNDPEVHNRLRDMLDGIDFHHVDDYRAVYIAWTGEQLRRHVDAAAARRAT